MTDSNRSRELAHNRHRTLATHNSWIIIVLLVTLLALSGFNLPTYVSYPLMLAMVLALLGHTNSLYKMQIIEKQIDGKEYSLRDFFPP